MGAPPAISTSSSTHRMPEISGSSHSSKKTRSRRGNRAADARMRVEISREAIGELFGLSLAADQAADHPDHLKNLGDAPLVEGDDGDAAPHELGARGPPADRKTRSTRSGFSAVDLVELRADERGDLRLLSRLRRPHGVAGYADDAIDPGRADTASRWFLQSGRRCESDTSILAFGQLVIWLSGQLRAWHPASQRLHSLPKDMASRLTTWHCA